MLHLILLVPIGFSVRLQRRVTGKEGGRMERRVLRFIVRTD